MDAAIIAKGNATLLPVFSEAKKEIDEVASSKPTEMMTEENETGLWFLFLLNTCKKSYKLLSCVSHPAIQVWSCTTEHWWMLRN